MSAPTPITVSVLVHTTAERAWDAFTNPTAITQWNFASAEWHCPKAQNELTVGGTFSYRMEARDGSFGFDFAGTFIALTPAKHLRFSMGEDREVDVTFEAEGAGTRVSQSFTPEATHSLEEQRSGWQAIMDNYKAYAESAS